MLLASKKARINRLLTNAQSIEVCSKQPFTHSCLKLQSMYGAIVYSGMREAPKFVRSNIFLCYALSIEVCTAADQPVYLVSNARSMLRSMLRTIAVYAVMLGAPKCTQSKCILGHTRSIEVCTEQPFTKVVLGASKYARSNHLLRRARSIEGIHGYNVRPNFGQLSFPLLFSISAIKMRISAILCYSKHARDILFSSTRSMLRSKCEHAH